MGWGCCEPGPARSIGVREVSSPLDRSPTFSAEQAEEFVAEHFGVHGTASALPSERDQNFRLRSDDCEFVVKIANAAESQQQLDLEQRMLEHLQANAPSDSPRLPRVRPTIAEEPWATVQSSTGEVHALRLMSWVPGRAVAELAPHTDGERIAWGRALGGLSLALRDFDHPHAHRHFHWDLLRAPEARKHTAHIADERLRAWCSQRLERFESFVLPRTGSLPTQVLHNDGNDHNLLVTADGASLRFGWIDFGDVVHGPAVFELAVSAAYAMLGSCEPLQALREVASGFHQVRPLAEEEIAVLFDAALARLALSASLAAVQTQERPDDEYLAISQAPLRATLERMDPVDPDFAHAALRDACDLPAHPRWPQILRTVHDAAQTKLAWVLGPPTGASGESPRPGPELMPDVLDLSHTSIELASWEFERPGAPLQEMLEARGPGPTRTIPAGRYDEVRALYQDPSFEVQTDAGPLPRTVHLGLDLFAPPGTTVHTPLAATVVDVQHDDQRLGYGCSVLLEHRAGEERFFTLYGHLRGASTEHLRPGRSLEAGAWIAELGDENENGGWAPHLHFQLVLDHYGRGAGVPGVALGRDRALWTSLCPNPAELLGWNAGEVEQRPMEEDRLLARRRTFLAPNLSLSYSRPLTILRGRGCLLEDAGGRQYLDCVNNVATVGHSHPRVVAAVREESLLLNTNSRYLHPQRTAYLRRLLAKFPEPLCVCILTCSGSEANELALRMARAHTGGADVVVLDGAYHGNTGTLVELSPYKCEGPGGSGLPSWVQKAELPDSYRGAFRGEPSEVSESYAGRVLEAFERITAAGRRPAAFLAESALGCGGQWPLPPGYLAKIYPEARARGAVCIADEVQVGFGRAGSHFWMFETQGVVPDIVTLGKPMGNGHPLAGVVTTAEIARSFANGMEYFNTFAASSVSCAVGLAVLDALQEEDLQANAARTGTELKSALAVMAERYPELGHVRGQGLFLGVEIVEDSATRKPDPARARALVEHCKYRGVLLSTDGPDDNVIKIKPPLPFAGAECDQLLDALEHACRRTSGR